MPIFLTGKNLLVGQLEKLEFGLRELRRNTDVELHERVDLRAWTTLGVGGVATLVARCHSAIAVIQTLDLIASHGLSWVCLGGGTRLIASDRGIRVPVVSLTGELARWEMELDGMIAGAGANLAQVCRATLRNRLAGLESLGYNDHSIGGLVRAWVDGTVRLVGIVDWIEMQRPGREPERWQATKGQQVPAAEDLHRSVVTRVRFRLRPSGLAEIKPRSISPNRTRALRSTGPVFLDSRDATAADLLAEAGCANAAVGGVRLGGPRGNELVAGRSATAIDVLDLCRKSRDRVLAATGVELFSALVF
ncbi:MAG: FAD-binding protein, partial [Candidatus Aminicenantes bacterium]